MSALVVGKVSGSLLGGLRAILDAAEKSVVNALSVSLGTLRARDPEDRTEGARDKRLTVGRALLCSMGEAS